MHYKPGKLSAVGGSVSDIDAIHNRPPLAQTFLAPNGEKFTVVVNHFKSKGSGTGQNADQNDGQARSNFDRVQQAERLDTWLDTNPTGTEPTAHSDSAHDHLWMHFTRLGAFADADVPVEVVDVACDAGEGDNRSRARIGDALGHRVE